MALRGGLGRRGVLKPRHRKTPKAPLEAAKGAAAAVLIDFKWRPRMERRGSFFLDVMGLWHEGKGKCAQVFVG